MINRCVIAELFTEGHAPFDLSQLLAYCSGTYTPEKVLEKIEDPSIKVRFIQFLKMIHFINLTIPNLSTPSPNPSKKTSKSSKTLVKGQGLQV